MDPQVASVTISPAEVTLEALEETAQLAAVAKTLPAIPFRMLLLPGPPSIPPLRR
jgi:hypothetical protein